MIPQALQIALLMTGGKISLPKGAKEKEGHDGDFLKFLENAGISPDKEMPEGFGETGGLMKGDWMALFRNCLLTQNISLQKTTLLNKIQPALRKLLLSDGISEKDVKAFMKTLFGGGKKGEIHVAELMDKVDAFRREKTKKSEEALFEAAEIPYMERLLRALGLDAERAAKAVEKSKNKDGCVRTESVLAEIKKAQLEAVLKTSAQPKEEDAGEIKTLLAKIGSQKEMAQIKGPITLNEFVRILARRVADKNGEHQLSEAAVKKEVKTLMDNIQALVEDQKKSGETKKSRITSFEGTPFHSTAKNAQSDEQKGGKRPHLEKPGTKKAVNTAELEKFLSPQKEKEASKIEGFAEAAKKGQVQDGAKVVNHHDGHPSTGDVKDTLIERPIHVDGNPKDLPRSIPYHVVNQVGRKLGVALKRGENRVKIHLKPPQLGSIEVSMAMKNNVLKLAVVAENHSVKELLVSHVHELRETLVEQGIDLQKVDVQIEYNFGQSMANARRDKQHSRLWEQHWGKQPQGEEDGFEEIRAMRSSWGRDGTLDMFA